MAGRQLADDEQELLDQFLRVGRASPYPQHLREQSEGASWKLRSGARWWEMPPESRVWQAACDHFVRWRGAGAFQALAPMDGMIAEADRRGADGLVPGQRRLHGRPGGATAAASPGPVAGLVGPLGNRVRDTPAAEPRVDRLRAVALVTQDVIGPGTGPSRPGPGHPDRVHHGGEPCAVVGVASRDDESERPDPAVAGQVHLAGRTTSGPAEGRVAEPSFRAPAACWWARTMVEWTDTSHSMSPAASTFA